MTTCNLKKLTPSKVRKVICSYRFLTIRDVTGNWNLKKITRQIPTENVGIHRVAATYLPRLLSQERKQKLIDISKELVEREYADGYFLKNIVTRDETWVYGSDVEPRAQSSQWLSETSPRPKSTASSVQYESDADPFFGRA